MWALSNFSHKMAMCSHNNPSSLLTQMKPTSVIADHLIFKFPYAFIHITGRINIWIGNFLMLLYYLISSGMYASLFKNRSKNVNRTLLLTKLSPIWMLAESLVAIFVTTFTWKLWTAFGSRILLFPYWLKHQPCISTLSFVIHTSQVVQSSTW